MKQALNISSVLIGLPIFCLAILLVAGEIFAQEKEPEKKKKGWHRPLEIGLSVSPDYADLLLRNNDGSATADWIIDGRNERETAKLGMSAGLHIGYRITQPVGIEIGVLYSNKGYQTKKRELTFGEMVDPRYGFVYSTGSGSAPESVRFIYNYHYVGIPLEVNLRIGGHDWTIIPSVGIVTEFLVKPTNTAVLFMSDGSTERNTEESGTDFKFVNLSPTVSLGVEYAFLPSMSVRAEPTFRFGVLQITDTPVTGHLYSAGLQISYYCKF